MANKSMATNRKKDLYEVVTVPETKEIVPVSMGDFYADRFSEYGASTLLSRAIPDVIDGLLPVRRKILFTFYNAKADKPKKATYFIGNCMSTVYVQGDSSLYGAMVSMAQWFKTLNPLITPTGSVGSPHDATPAAPRYLELSLSKFAKDVFFDNYDEKVVWMKDNYDATMKEPVALPALFPTIFNVGVTGIASGYASEIPPHRVSDICDITIKLMENPDISTRELTKDFRPEFPLGGIIMNEAELPAIYENGNGVIRCQATIEVGEYNNKEVLVIKDLPYKVSTEQVLLKIASLCKVDPKTKKEGALHSLIDNVLDISDKKEPVKLIILPKKNASLEVIKNILLLQTPLASSIKYICNVLHNGQLYVNASAL